MGPGEDLLVRFLTKEQEATWRESGGFWLDSPSGNRYWVGRTTKLYRNGEPRWAFCCHTLDFEGNPLPTADHLLAQKLLIESNEELFLATAHAYGW
jgi:hypothetical protein